MSLVPLPGGDLRVGTSDPWLGCVDADGRARWAHKPPKPDVRAPISHPDRWSDGARVDFGFQEFGRTPARFDLATLALTRDPPPDGRTARPRQEGLPVAGWLNEGHPTLNGRPLALKPYEMSRSLGVEPAGDRFVLGPEWYLRASVRDGTPIWQHPNPGPAWAVNITADGRLVVAAYGDGTIRWHRMTDGAEPLAVMPLPDQTNGVAWTPEGFYAASEGAHPALARQSRLEQAGRERARDRHSGVPPTRCIAARTLRAGNPRALGLAELAQHNKEVAV